MTWMEKEILETPDVIAKQAENTALTELSERFAQQPPNGLLTVGRGTSDHAADYLSYLLMRYRGLPCTSIPLSLNTVYQTDWQLTGQLVLSISQSGGSPDLVESVKNFRRAGALTATLVNTVPSPLAEASELVCDIGAGKENSVAATKSFVATLSAGLRMFTGLYGDPTLASALAQLPEKISRAQELDWSKAVDVLKGVNRMFILGRGPGLAIAREAALKTKETCLIQGEALSGAEVKHGPMALINSDQALVILAPPDESQAGLIQTAEQFRKMGARVLLAADESVTERDLPLVDAGHPALQGLTTIQSFYRMVEKLSAARGIETDNPPNLNKLTETR